MANNDNIIYAKFNHGRETTTDSRSQYAYGQVLKISGLHLPTSFDADISNKGDKQAKAVIGTDNELLIDDAFFLSGKDVIVMINVHAADKDGRTKYIIRIPVEKRPERADIELEPVEQDVISQAIATLNEAVEQTTANAESVENSANQASEFATAAEISATNAANSESLVEEYMNRAEIAAEGAEQSETNAKTSEENAKQSEIHAEEIATEIEQYTGRAETAAGNAESSATIATIKANEITESANIASAKAGEAAQSAQEALNSQTASAISAQNASTSETNAQTYMGRAETAAENAEQSEINAKTSEINAKQSETNATQIAENVSQYTTDAQSAAESAIASATTATNKADEASGYADIASAKASEASASATNANNSAVSAQSFAEDAEEYKNSASASATSAQASAQSASADKEIVLQTKTEILEKVDDAEEYAESTQSAKQAIEDMTVSATTLPPESEATVEKTVNAETGVVNLEYGIPQGIQGDKGDKGNTGNGIASINLNNDYTLTITYTDGTTMTTGSIRGEQGIQGETGATGARGETGASGTDGSDGVGIASTVLNSDYTLTITLTDGTSYTTDSIRGEQGEAGSDADVTAENIASALGYTPAGTSDLDDYVTKDSLDGAGITARTYTTIMDDSVTTTDDGEHDYPYGIYEGVSLNERYSYRVTFNGAVYESKVGTWYEVGEDHWKGYGFIGNITYYDSNVSGLLYDGSALPFCLVYNYEIFNGLQILTPEVGTYSIKIERLSYTKTDLPNVLIYGDEEIPIKKTYNNGSSYVSVSIGENALDARGAMAIGFANKCSGDFAKAFGYGNTSSGINSAAIGAYTTSSGTGSFSEGQTTTASGNTSHAEGYLSIASGMTSHAEGHNTTASGRASHSEGGATTSSGIASHAEGNKSSAIGSVSHAEGFRTTANHLAQHVFGQDNIPDDSTAAATERGNYVEIVGNGTSASEQSNARTLDWSGNEKLAGGITLGMDTADETGLTAVELKAIKETNPVTDVQINGTSVTENGIANIPIANGQNILGLTQYNSTYGVTVNASGRVQVFPAIPSEIKGGTNDRRPITPSVQNEAVFYGLAKAAGDTTQSSSSNTVGTYTDEAKTAIKQMLDVKDDYDSLVVTVSGTDPVITGKPSYRYNCGELYTLNITPPASGTMDIIFTSGATPTVLTLPNAVKMPDWWAGIETNTTYEMCITDGTYCGVMSWAI